MKSFVKSLVFGLLVVAAPGWSAHSPKDVKKTENLGFVSCMRSKLKKVCKKVWKKPVVKAAAVVGVGCCLCNSRVRGAGLSLFQSLFGKKMDPRAPVKLTFSDTRGGGKETILTGFAQDVVNQLMQKAQGTDVKEVVKLGVAQSIYRFVEKGFKLEEKHKEGLRKYFKRFPEEYSTGSSNASMYLAEVKALERLDKELLGSLNSEDDLMKICDALLFPSSEDD